MFYGWGKKSKQWPMADGKVLVCTYSYLSLMFIFALGYKKRWLVADNDRNNDQELTRAEVESRYGDDAPDIGPWAQYGLFIGLAAGIVVGVIADTI